MIPKNSPTYKALQKRLKELEPYEVERRSILNALNPVSQAERLLGPDKRKRKPMTKAEKAKRSRTMKAVWAAKKKKGSS